MDLCKRFAICVAVLILGSNTPWSDAIFADEKTPGNKNSILTAVKETNTAVVPQPRPRRKNWMKRHAEFNERAKQGDIDLVFLGDSITEEWDVAGKKVWDKYYAGRRAVNFGFSGDQTQHILWRIDHGNVDGIEPKLVVLMIGTNNYTGNTAEEITAGIEAVVDRLKTKLPKSKILVMGLLPRDDARDATREKFATVNQQVAKLADDKTVFFLDLTDKYLTKGGAVDKVLIPDLVHPEEKGFEVWAEAIEPYVTKWVGPGGNSAAVGQPRTQRKNWIKQHEGFNARAKEGNVDLVFLGDSITEYWKKHGKAVWGKYYGSREAMNIGISGDRTEHVLWRIDHGNVDGIQPKILVLMIGTNNFPTNTPQEVAEGIETIVLRLKAKLPETKILLMAILPRLDDVEGDGTREKLAEVNRTIAKLADDKTVFFLDIGDKYLDAQGAVSKDLLPDFVHPNEKGYEVWAESIEPYVAKWVDGR